MDEILSVCRKIADKYGAKNIKVAITGGEPFVRKDLFHLIARITEMGFRASVVTNGYLMREEHINLLFASGIRSLSISLDGLRENHNWLRGKPDSFQKAVNALKLLKDSGLFYVEAITTVNKRNIQELDRIEDLLAGIGLHGWRLAKTFPIGRAKGHPDLFIGDAELKYLIDFVRDHRKNKKRKIKDISFVEEGYFGDKYELEIRGYFVQCPAGVNILTVMADGSITGCAAASRNFIQGSIKKDDITDIWENQFQLFRDRSWMRRGICGSCGSWENCRGDGFHLWEKGEMNPALCNLSKMA